MVSSDKIKKPIIIAEAGVNHDGSFDKALKLIDAAAAAKADYIKFQTFITENIVTQKAETARYQKNNCGENSQFEMLKKLQLSFDRFRDLKNYCDLKGIGFLSTPFDKESLQFLLTLNPDFIKIPSGELTNLPLLRDIAGSGKRVIISTGMATMEEIAAVLNIFYDKGYNKNNIILLHCTTQYPTPFNQVNLKAMKTLESAFSLPTGYSDHTSGFEVAIAATAMGAAVIEKHFTIDSTDVGPDHIASLNPLQLKEMVGAIRNVVEALGKSEKIVTDSEKENIRVARKSIVAKKDIKKGELLREENLTVKRPGLGLSPMLWDEIIGQKAKRDFEADEIIEI